MCSPGLGLVLIPIPKYGQLNALSSHSLIINIVNRDEVSSHRHVKIERTGPVSYHLDLTLGQ